MLEMRMQNITPSTYRPKTAACEGSQRSPGRFPKCFADINNARRWNDAIGRIGSTRGRRQYDTPHSGTSVNEAPLEPQISSVYTPPSDYHEARDGSLAQLVQTCLECLE